MGVAQRGSIFSQKLDRVAFTAYFLGAVVPLLALGAVVHHYVLPSLSDRFATLGLIGLVFSIGVLSLASFFTLRRTTRRSLDRIDRDNRRLAGLLEASRGLSASEHAGDAAGAAARAALALAGADAAYILVRSQPGNPPTRMAGEGDDAEKLEQELVEPLVEMANLVMSDGRPALRGPDKRHPVQMAAGPLPGEAVPAGALIALRTGKGAAPFEAPELDALSALGGLVAVALRNADLRDLQRNFFTHVTDILVSALDSHLGYHTGHGNRVAQYANRIGREMQLDDHRLQRLHFAALLHDIGMLKMERHAQMNPKTCEKHTVIGARMLMRIRLWEELAPLVQHHHEWWDGSGYPEGISGDTIPLESRIIAVCDAFDTITSNTSYKDVRRSEEAVGEVGSGAGTQFDPEVVNPFLALVRRGEMEIIRT